MKTLASEVGLWRDDGEVYARKIGNDLAHQKHGQVGWVVISGQVKNENNRAPVFWDGKASSPKWVSHDQFVRNQQERSWLWRENRRQRLACGKVIMFKADLVA